MESEKKKILVLDDDERWLRRMAAILKPDYEATLTRTKDEALDESRKYPFALAVLDMKLPEGVSGLEVFDRLREQNPDLHAIILTGYPGRGSMRDSFKKGVVDYLEKGSPSLAEDLRAVIAEVFTRQRSPDARALIGKGESDELEFKTSARWDARTNKVNKDLEKVIVKTVAAFLNSKGGRLLIGVDDNGRIIGTQPDYDTLGRKNRDGYESYLTDLLLGAFGKDLSLWLSIYFHEIQEKDVCEILAKPAPKPVFVADEKGGDHLYVRTGNSTRQLSTKEAIGYCNARWKD